VYHILSKDQTWVNGFTKEIDFARKNIHECIDCFRIFKSSNNEDTLCERCRSQQIDKSTLAIVEKNIDAENFIEKTNFLGKIFILGGVYPVIEKKSRPRVRQEELLKLVQKINFDSSLKEIILCTSLTNDGVFTASVIRQKLKESFPEVKITTLGRGFSTGTEMEYADKDTLLNALHNRSEFFI
jgi:recombination protein RecR